MFSLAHMMHLLADELTCLGAGRLSFLFVFSRSLDSFAFRHECTTSCRNYPFQWLLTIKQSMYRCREYPALCQYQLGALSRR